VRETFKRIKHKIHPVSIKRELFRMSGTARHTKEMIEAAKKKLAASTDPVDKVNYIF